MKLHSYIMEPMFVMFLIAVSFIRNYSFCSHNFIKLIKKLNAKRFLKHIIKVNDVSALRYAIIKLKSQEYKV